MFATPVMDSARQAALCFPLHYTLLCTNFDTDELFQFDFSGSGAVLYDATDGMSWPLGLGYNLSGDLLVTNDNSDVALSFPSGGGKATTIADSNDGLLSPGDVSVDRNGQVFILDFYLNTIWLVDAIGLVSSFDILPDQPTSIATRYNGDIYVAAGFTTAGINVYRYPSGSVSQLTTLATIPPQIYGWAGLQLSLDETTLYLTTDRGLYTIDADSGATNMVVDGRACSADRHYRIPPSREVVKLW
jgi:hypothetical protein